jgi:N-formylglutamate amidohydrolase
MSDHPPTPPSEAREFDETCLVIRRPSRQTLPLVVASPHSGRVYPESFVARSRLSPIRLRSSEDGFVDEIFAAAPTLGAPLLQAQFPRVFVDVNREPYELDPAMFSTPLPSYVTTRNARIAAGLGTIARVVSNSEPIYGDKLTFSEANQRIKEFYDPYHRALAALIEETRSLFGFCILLDCHSMPSGAAQQRGGPATRAKTIDTVLGDCHATACAPLVTSEAERHLTDMNYAVRRNNPYAGGFVTRHYGRPRDGIHALQIELNRGLYMDETRIERLPSIDGLAEDMATLIGGLGVIQLPAIAFDQAAE